MVCDPAGTRYFLSWTVTHPGRRHLGLLPPQVVAQIKPGQGLYACRFTLISYQASIRKAGVPAVFVMNDHEVWDEEASTLCLRDAQHEHECAWSFDGERMDLAVSSPTLAFNLKMQGGSQVMWAEDQPGAEGLGRDSADGGHGFSYSLPRLRIAGSVTYADERGKPTAVDVSGSGWGPPSRLARRSAVGLDHGEPAMGSGDRMPAAHHQPLATVMTIVVRAGDVTVPARPGWRARERAPPRRVPPRPGAANERVASPKRGGASARVRPG